jgi:hypothetical protein
LHLTAATQRRFVAHLRSAVFRCYALTGNRTPVSTLKEWRPNR